MSNTKWGWPLANQQTVKECELVLYALVALFHQYDTVGVPIFRKEKENFLTKLDVVTSLDGLYTVSPTQFDNAWEFNFRLGLWQIQANDR